MSKPTDTHFVEDSNCCTIMENLARGIDFNLFLTLAMMRMRAMYCNGTYSRHRHVMTSDIVKSWSA